MASGGTFPPLPSPNNLPGVHELRLHSGAKFKGERVWRKGRQEMEAEFMHVDRDNDNIYGILTYYTPNNGSDAKVTYFEGEIIGPKHSFETRKWFADADTDKKYWWKFDCFNKFGMGFNNDEFYSTYMKGSDNVYMRWKESDNKENVHYLTSGFYYVCLSKAVGIVEGIYYGQEDEDWNENTFFLKSVPERGLPVFQFR